jgi:hypothetical protein
LAPPSSQLRATFITGDGKLATAPGVGRMIDVIS